MACVNLSADPTILFSYHCVLIPRDRQDLKAFYLLIEFDNYATHPCPYGYYNHASKECVCEPGVVKRYVSNISGPLLDRINLHVEVAPRKRRTTHDHRATRAQ